MLFCIITLLLQNVPPLRQEWVYLALQIFSGYKFHYGFWQQSEVYLLKLIYPSAEIPEKETSYRWFICSWFVFFFFCNKILNSRWARVSFSLSAFSQQFHSGRIYIVWAACKESGFQQIGIWLQNPSLLSDLLCIVPVRIWPIFCSGSLEFFAVGHPLLRAGLDFLLLTSVSDCVLTSPFIKCQNFCREICSIWNKFQWPSSCQVEAIWAISFFPENSDLLEFCSHTPENLHSNRFFIIFNNLLESFEITEVKSLRVSTIKIPVLQFSTTLFQNITKFN